MLFRSPLAPTTPRPTTPLPTTPSPQPQVKARSAAREVIATYSVDDIYIELVIQLPQNYPLGSITVESGRRVGVAVQQWRNWMLQLSTYLTHQVHTQYTSHTRYTHTQYTSHTRYTHTHTHSTPHTPGRNTLVYHIYGCG